MLRCNLLVKVRAVLVHRDFANKSPLSLLHSLVGENLAALLVNSPKVARCGRADVECSALKAN